MKNSIGIFVLGILLFFSCSKENEKPGDYLSSINKKYFVPLSSARYIAEHFDFYKKDSRSRIAVARNISSIQTINDEHNTPAYYVVNYTDSMGFLILSADYRQEAVLGFDDANSINLSETPQQLDSLVASEIDEINMLREEETDSISAYANYTWETLPAPPEEDPINPGTDNCGNSVYEEKLPLLLTNWGQSCGYNDQCPAISCGPCGHAYTGCVATAMAQIIYYNKWPNTYNWNSMATTYGTAECARLMKNIGIAVSMDYQCGGSGADTKRKAEPAFENSFGYASSTQYLDYGGNLTYETVVSELKLNRPVLFRGRGASGGHAWVCDGYRRSSNACYGSLFFHMNWGWSGSSNGYYGFNNFNPSGYTFNDERGVVIVRKP